MCACVCVLPTLSFAWLSLWLRCCRCQRCCCWCCCCFCVLMFLLLLIFYDWRSFVGCWRCCPVSASPFHTQFVYIACYICGAMPVSLLQFDNHCEVELSWAATRHGVAIRSYINVCCCCCCLIILYAHHLAILHSCCCFCCCCWRAFNTFLFYAVDSLIYYTHTHAKLINMRLLLLPYCSFVHLSSHHTHTATKSATTTNTNAIMKL